MNYRVCHSKTKKTLSNQKISNFHFDLSLKLSQGEVHDFPGEVQKLSWEVQSDLRGGAHPPHTSPQNPVMAYTVLKTLGLERLCDTSKK